MILHRWLASLLFFFSCSTMACEITALTPSIQFGSVSSFTVSSTQQQSSAQPHAGITCDFSTLVSLLSGDYVSVTFTSLNGGQMTTQGDASSIINYQIFGDSSLSQEYVFGQLYTFTDTDLLDCWGCLETKLSSLFMLGRELEVTFRPELIQTKLWRLGIGITARA